MNRFDNTRKMFGIFKHVDYAGTPIWNLKRIKSTYYDYNVDTQCSVPGRSAREILRELGLEV